MRPNLFSILAATAVGFQAGALFMVLVRSPRSEAAPPQSTVVVQPTDVVGGLRPVPTVPAYVVDAPSLTLSGMSSRSGSMFAPGETIFVHFNAPPLPRDAWAGVIPSQIDHGDESVNDQYDVEYQYLEGRTSGTLELHAPTTPGRYDIRLNSTDAGGVELASVTFEVAGY